MDKDGNQKVDSSVFLFDHGLISICVHEPMGLLIQKKGGFNGKMQLVKGQFIGTPVRIDVLFQKKICWPICDHWPGNKLNSAGLR